jgi:hypothetical protein
MRDCSTPAETRAGFLRVAEIMASIPGQETLTSSLRASAPAGALDDSQGLGVRTPIIDSFTRQSAALRRAVASALPPAATAATRAAPSAGGRTGGTRTRHWCAIAGVIAANLLCLYLFVLAVTRGGGACSALSGAELEACYDRNLLLVSGAWILVDLGLGVFWLVRHRHRTRTAAASSTIPPTPADGEQRVVCPGCGAGYGTTMVAASILSQSPFLADMESWSTKIICRNCRQEIWVSGSRSRAFGKT